jgi:type IV pilus assembly protein PilB
MRIRPFLDKVVAAGHMTVEQARALETRHHGNPVSALEELVQYQVAPKEALCRIYGDTLGRAYVDLSRTIIQPEVVSLLPREFAKAHRVIALYRFGDGITVAAADPLNLPVMDDAARHTRMPVTSVFSLPSEIIDAIEVQYATFTVLEELRTQIDLDRLLPEDLEDSPERLAQLADDQNVVDLTRQLLLIAIKERASDIHLEPSEHELRVRLRVDGVLQERHHLSRRLLAPLVSRLKLMAGCDIAERRRPQDGRIAFALATRSVDLRFSSVPAINGEKVVLRVLGSIQRQSIPAIEELSLSASNLAILKRIMSTPNGVFFVTGPTGSGKTTTLYAILKHLNRPTVNVMTVEDPVEYRLPGVNQVQVNPTVDLTFSTALRAFLRQDPNVILVGEVRDMETAKIVSQAALTGHLVLSSMHTNNALQAVTRLVEIGVEPFLVAPSIIGVSAQRLVRRICPICREEVPMPPDRAARFFGDIGDRVVIMSRGRGCAGCGGTGYSGRLAIHEIFMLTDTVRRLIARNASILDIQTLALTHGFRPMIYDGLKKVLRGLTTLEELDRVTTLQVDEG